MILGRRIRTARQDKNLTQEALGKALDLDRTTIAKWEVGSTYPDAPTIERLSIILEVGVEYLFGHENKSGKLAADISRLNISERKAVEALIQTYKESNKKKGDC